MEYVQTFLLKTFTGVLGEFSRSSLKFHEINKAQKLLRSGDSNYLFRHSSGQSSFTKPKCLSISSSIEANECFLLLNLAPHIRPYNTWLHAQVSTSLKR